MIPSGTGGVGPPAPPRGAAGTRVPSCREPPGKRRAGVLRRFWIQWRHERDGGVSVIAGDRVLHMNPVAGSLWMSIEKARDREGLHRILRHRYRGVPDRTLRRDVDLMVDGWLRSTWIVHVDDPIFPFPDEMEGSWGDSAGSTRS
jgi:hypothetical protein